MKIILSLCFAILLAGCAPALTPVPSPVEESPTPAATWTPVPPFIFLFLQVVDIAIHFNNQRGLVEDPVRSSRGDNKNRR